MPLSYVAPSPELAVELGEVRADAEALADMFDKLNTPLPLDFPKGAIIELAAALRGLPDGTARGCLRPLNEAQSQLATIRSQYIRHDDHTPHGLNEEYPIPLRGEPVDQYLRNLMSSVSTALQTANRLASDEPEPNDPEAGALPPSDSSTSELIKKSTETQKELESERNQLEALHLNSDLSDTLGRRLTDTIVLNQLGRGELRLPRIVSARLRRIATTLGDYPELITRAAKAISNAADIADYVHEKWHKFQERIFRAGTSTVREIADDMSRFAQKLDRKTRSVDASQEADSPDDFDLEMAVSLIHAGSEPPSHWKPFIEHLPLGSRKLRSLAPLAGLSNLRELSRISVKASNFSKITELTSLTSLDLSGTKIVSLRPLAALSKLKSLDISRTNVTNLESISNLSNLRSINFSSTQIDDISPLSKLRSLEQVIFNDTNVSSLAPLAELSNLQTLQFRNSRVADLLPLINLTNVEYLSLAQTKITDLSPITTLTQLTNLDISNTNVSDLTPLKSLSRIRYFRANNSKISNLTTISEWKSLTSLTLSETPIRDLSVLSQLKSLLFLDLAKTKIFDLTPISKLANLQTLKLSMTSVSDLRPLASIKNLRSLDVDQTNVTDLHAISTLSFLSSLSIQSTAVVDLSPLASLSNLGLLILSKESNAEIPKTLSERKYTYIAKI